MKKNKFDTSRQGTWFCIKITTTPLEIYEKRTIYITYKFAIMLYPKYTIHTWSNKDSASRIRSE